MPFATFLLFFAVNSVLGLYKLQPKEGKEGEPNLLVPEILAKNDYIYLYQFNRTSSAPTLAVLDQFIEGLLILMNVKFHRIPNQFFLGSQSTGAAPFIQFDGKYHDGVENILNFLNENEKYKEKIKKLTFEEDQEITDFALDFSFKILMKDRSRRLDKETENEASTSTKTIPPIQKSIKPKMTEEELKATSEMEGLDFMLYDQGIREQMIPAVSDLFGKRDVTIGQFKVGLLNRKFWTAYFDVTNDGNEVQKYEEFKENVDGLTAENWKEFQDVMETYITKELHTVLISNEEGNASEDKLKSLLEQNKYEDGRSYAEIDDVELYNIFMEKLKNLQIIKTLKQIKFWGGVKPSMADMAFFSILVQFFEMPLNIPEFKQLFQPNRLNENDLKKLNRKSWLEKQRWNAEVISSIRSVLAAYYERMKTKLGVGKKRWTVLTQKPWPMNYEEIWWKGKYPDKYDGPYIIETDELENLDNVSYPIMEEIFQKLEEKAEELNSGNRLIKYLKRKNIKKEKLLAMMKVETAAYLCNLGTVKERNMGEECRKNHEKEIVKIGKMPSKIRQKTRKIVYGTIVDFYDRLVRNKVTEEINRVAELVKNDPDNAANYFGEDWQ